MRAAAALPARPGAADALTALASAGHRVAVLTKSGAEGGAATLRANGLLAHVERVVGVDGVGSFKPHPSVYLHALSELDAPAGDAMMVAAHAWDLTGAAHVGMRTAWVAHEAKAYGS